MPGKYHLLIVLTTLWMPRLLLPQIPESLEQQTEELLAKDELAEVPVEFYETCLDLLSHPLNLNAVTAQELEFSGLFTPFQIHMIIKYREEFGELYSIYELAGLSGFRESRIREIEPYLTLKEGTGREINRGSKHMILITLGKILPEAEGYRLKSGIQDKPAYTGSPIKTSLRMKSDIGRNLSLGLSYEKDAGEQFLRERSPQFVSGYIHYQGHRFIKQLAIGNFRLHHGLGLANGTGFIQSPESFQLNKLSISKLKPYASLTEYNYEQGIGCRMDMNRADLLIWVSCRYIDLSLSRLKQQEGKIDWMELQRKTGMHRTMSELKGTALGYRFHSGYQIIHRHKNLAIGHMAGIEIAGLTRKGIDSLKTAPEPFLRGIFSLHGNWHMDRLVLFGELTVWKLESTAILIGSRIHFNDFFQGLLMLHYYGSDNRGFNPSTYGSGSSPINEHGVAVGLHAEPGAVFTADFLAELFSFQTPRYLTDFPSTGYRYSCILKSTANDNLQWKFRISKKIWQTTPKAHETGLSNFQNSETTRFDFRYTYSPASRLKWQSRFIVSILSREGKPIPGQAVIQQLNLHLKNYMKCTFQCVVFNVKDWDNRIYIYEPGLYYGFSFPAYYGIGQKVTMVISSKVFRKVTLAAKASMTTYHDRNETGSGNDLKAGNKKGEIGIQLRLNL